MAGEIFISYRRADEAWARLLHRQLKAEGVEAWYDGLVGPGQEWRTATAKALEASQIFILLFSENATQSSDIVKELAAATHEKKLVVPVRLENIEPKGAFLYELASRNWVNAYEDTEAKLADLAKGLAHLVRTGARDESVLPFERAPGTSPPSRKPMRKPVLIAAAALVVAAALAALLWISPRLASVVASSQPSPAGVSLAVLPFLNLSSDKDQEFFSDGMTEEITSALAKVPGLTVIGRTSAFQFKGQNRDMRAIGEALGAKNLIEGSVRKAGDQVRITVQLIKAADGTHLWTESYDRKLTDIFAVQEDIATAVAGALQVPLGLKQGQNLISDRTADTKSYEAYLRAKELIRVRSSANLISAIALLQQVNARDPHYAPAWGLLASAYALLPGYQSLNFATADEQRQETDTDLPKAEAAAREALALDANNADGWTALGSIFDQRKRPIQAEDAFKRVLKRDPKNVDALHFYAHNLTSAGRLKEAVALRRQIVALDPLDTLMQSRLAHELGLSGKYDAALAIKGAGLSNVAATYAVAGRFKDAADALLKIRPGTYPAGMAETAARVLREAPAKVPSPQDLPSFPINLTFVYLYVGAANRAMEFPEYEVKAGYSGNFVDSLWYPAAAPLRRTERFKTLMRNAGYVAYWRARGFPDLCHPVGADDFACN